MITANEIKPMQIGKSDFYSWQLYRWVKKFPDRITIWSATWNSGTGVDRKNKSLYIGDQRDGSWIHARQLQNLCLTNQKLHAYAYGKEHDTDNWEDVTAKFWDEYKNKGVCAIHKNVHIWLQNGKSRVCQRCGHTQNQITEIIERLRWVDSA
jgi:hypothetical protein